MSKRSWRGYKGNGIVAMPDGIVFHNGRNEPCDMAAGPCACGAWHSRKDWLWRIKKNKTARLGYSKKQLDFFRRIIRSGDKLDSANLFVK